MSKQCRPRSVCYWMQCLIRAVNQHSVDNKMDWLQVEVFPVFRVNMVGPCTGVTMDPVKTITITKTCICNCDLLKPHFYIVKLGLTGVYIIFSYFCSQT